MTQERSDAELARLAAREARRLKSGYVGPEHVFLGLFESEEGSDVAAVFQNLGKSRRDIETFMAESGFDDKDPGPSKGIVWSPAAQILLAVARGLALAQGSRRVTGVHVLVALAYESGDATSNLLTALEVGPDSLLAQLVALGMEVPTVPLRYATAESTFGPRVFFAAADARAVIRAMLATCLPESKPWGWNVSEDGRYWVQAHAEIPTEEVVRAAVADVTAVSAEPRYRGSG